MIKLKWQKNGKFWYEKQKAAKFEEKVKKLVLQRFHKQIYIFRKKVSKRMLTKKLQDYVVEVKEEFILERGRCIYCQGRKGKRYVSSLKNNCGRGMLDP